MIGIDYKQLLEETATQMQELADRISYKGSSPFSVGDKRLLRMAVVPTLKGMFEEVVVEFLAGSELMREDSPLTTIVRTMEELR